MGRTGALRMCQFQDEFCSGMTRLSCTRTTSTSASNARTLATSTTIPPSRATSAGRSTAGPTVARSPTRPGAPRWPTRARSSSVPFHVLYKRMSQGHRAPARRRTGIIAGTRMHLRMLHPVARHHHPNITSRMEVEVVVGDRDKGKRIMRATLLRASGCTHLVRERFLSPREIRVSAVRFARSATGGV